MTDAPLPDWLTPLPDAEQQRATDGWAIETGEPGIELMERAGAGLAEALVRRVPRGRVVVVCGKGNNGGDGLVVARLLREPAGRSTCCCWRPARSCTATRATNFDRLPGRGRRAVRGRERSPAPPAIVDAILGTGFAGEPREPARRRSRRSTRPPPAGRRS